VSVGDWLNACGTQYAELIDGEDRWDEDQDFQHPLSFLVWAEGSRDLEIEFVRVEYPTG
jgi:hypothetical protein